jgi:hypothetical protein
MINHGRVSGLQIEVFGLQVILVDSPSNIWDPKTTQKTATNLPTNPQKYHTSQNCKKLGFSFSFS